VVVVIGGRRVVDGEVRVRVTVREAPSELEDASDVSKAIVLRVRVKVTGGGIVGMVKTPSVVSEGRGSSVSSGMTGVVSTATDFVVVLTEVSVVDDRGEVARVLADVREGVVAAELPVEAEEVAASDETALAVSKSELVVDVSVVGEVTGTIGLAIPVLGAMADEVVETELSVVVTLVVVVVVVRTTGSYWNAAAREISAKVLLPGTRTRLISLTLSTGTSYAASRNSNLLL